MIFSFKSHKSLLLVIIFFISIGCQLQEPYNNHGILNLKNRSDKLTIGKSNKNDALDIIGQPHSKSVDNKDEWIFFERVLTKGDFHKLGQNVLKSNNILILKFDKYGILENKKLFDKDAQNKIAFSKGKTENNLTQKSFVQKFLSSLRAKMYGKK
jgi:outer membrane protein assembly factor BamE (lipoprotein component of BamABCDE complex)|tara:strand:- start:205 stop:669 length:465 start_codon:yes stop_codon:yes gene_type:complete